MVLFLSSSLDVWTSSSIIIITTELQVLRTLYGPSSMKFTKALAIIFASLKCAEPKPNTEDELREELSKTEAQIAELRELIETQKKKKHDFDRGRIAIRRSQTSTVPPILEAAREDFTEDRRRLAADQPMQVVHDAASLKIIALCG